MKKLVFTLLVLSSSAFATEPGFVGNSDIGSSTAKQSNVSLEITRRVENYLTKMAGEDIDLSYVSKDQMHEMFKGDKELKKHIQKRWKADEISAIEGFYAYIGSELGGDIATVKEDRYLIKVKKDGKDIVFIDGLEDRYGVNRKDYIGAGDEVRQYCSVIRFAADDVHKTSAIMVYCDPSTGLSNLMIRAQE